MGKTEVRFYVLIISYTNGWTMQLSGTIQKGLDAGTDFSRVSRAQKTEFQMNSK